MKMTVRDLRACLETLPDDMAVGVGFGPIEERIEHDICLSKSTDGVSWLRIYDGSDADMRVKMIEAEAKNTNEAWAQFIDENESDKENKNVI